MMVKAAGWVRGGEADEVTGGGAVKRLEHVENEYDAGQPVPIRIKYDRRRGG